jgi:hypothetical protein
MKYRNGLAIYNSRVLFVAVVIDPKAAIDVITNSAPKLPLLLYASSFNEC